MFDLCGDDDDDDDKSLAFSQQTLLMLYWWMRVVERCSFWSLATVKQSGCQYMYILIAVY